MMINLKFFLYLSRQSGHRVGENLQNIIPFVVYYCQCKDETCIDIAVLIASF
jgi:hypothetical protein